MATAGVMLLVSCEGPDGPQAPLQAELDSVQVLGDGSTLLLRGIRGDCDTAQAARVQETTHSVRVAVPLLRHGNSCAAVALLLQVPVHLERPLGHRKVRDDATGAVLPRRQEVGPPAG